MSSPPPFPILAVQHMPSNAAGTVVNVVGRACSLNVKEALDKEELVAGSVYFAPPNYHLLVEKGGMIALTVDEPVNHKITKACQRRIYDQVKWLDPKHPVLVSINCTTQQEYDGYYNESAFDMLDVHL
jgi:hypothetical protein